MPRIPATAKARTSLRDAAEVIAGPMLDLIKAYHSTTGDMKKYLEENIGLLFRHMEKFSPIHMSKAAYGFALEVRPKRPDLRNYNFKGICRIRESKEKPPFFFWEHAYPVGNFIEEIRFRENLTREELVDLLCKAEVAVILRTENERLDKKFKTGRENWRSCYEFSEIEIIEADATLS